MERGANVKVILSKVNVEVMTKKSIFRMFARLLIVIVLGVLALCVPTKTGEFIFGFVGVILIDIYGTLIEEGKL